MLHPLGGSNLTTLLRAFCRPQPLSWRKLPMGLITTASVLARFPFYQFERLIHSRAINDIELPSDPIFIIGHWRSGTTHLHNLLSQDPQFGSINFLQTALPWDFIGQVRLSKKILSRSLPENRGMDNVKLTIDTPQEEEMALGNMGPLCYYYCYYFPQEIEDHFDRAVLLEGISTDDLQRFENNFRYLLKKLTLFHGLNKRLLLKNPANTGRIRWLRQLYPNAKFIHIHRNSYSVFSSTLKHYQRTLSAFAWQSYKGIDFEKITLRHYRLLMQRYFDDRASIPPENFYELSLDAVENDAIREIDKIYQHFSLPNRVSALEFIDSYNKKLSNYRKNSYSLTQSQISNVLKHWDFVLKEYGYDVPDEIEVKD